MTEPDYDVVIVGGGVAGLTAATFTARHGLETVVLDAGGSLLRRNAHLENVPGFPAGIDARLFLEMLEEQATRSGADRRTVTVTHVRERDEGFTVETEGGATHSAGAVVAATKNRIDYLEGIDGVGIVDRGKTFVDCDERGRTGVDSLYAAGRLAEKSHQAIVAAGHGAEVATTLLEEHDRGFYHDWVAPEGYFTGRDRSIPPGCEEIDDEERRRRTEESLLVLQRAFEEPALDPPENHPDVR